MEVMRELMKRPHNTENLAVAVFVIAVLYTIYRGTAHTILVGLGFTLIVLGALPHQVALAFLVGASTILLVQTSRSQEGFESGKEGSDAPTIAEDPTAAALSIHEKEEDKENKEEKKLKEAEAVDELLHGIQEKQKENELTGKRPEGFSNGKPMLPDNADRKEMLELGKPYKLPNENDDKGFHLDSGTTFLNAYKALKPDQIAAMTRDTQELLATQKSLVGMLESFGPLMKDMNKITGFFGPNGPSGP